MVIKILSTGASLEAVRSERVGHIKLRNTVPETSNSHALVMGEGTVGHRGINIMPSQIIGMMYIVTNKRPRQIEGPAPPPF